MYQLNYRRTQSVAVGLECVLLIVFPFVLVGGLFLLSRFLRRKQPTTAAV